MNYSRGLRRQNTKQAPLTTSMTTGFIFGGAMIGFVLARIQTLSLTSRMCPAHFPAPSDPEAAKVMGIASSCYWISRFVRYRAGMGLHLATSFPAGVLAVVQFVPKIRHRWILYHRIAGYVAVVLMTAGNVGAMMMADTAMGGKKVHELCTFIFSPYLFLVSELAPCSHFSSIQTSIWGDRQDVHAQTHNSDKSDESAL